MTATPPPIACLAYTAAAGWHLATVDVEQIVACELEDAFGIEPAQSAAEQLALLPVTDLTTRAPRDVRGGVLALIDDGRATA